ncbi:MAG: YfiR family protein [bacterium]|nr:YfiR family protein [bacterium]
MTQPQDHRKRERRPGELPVLLRLFRLGILMCLVTAMEVAAQPRAVPEVPATQLEAAYLSHLAEFTTWPKDAFAGKRSAIVVGFVESSPSDIADSLETAVREGLSIKERPVDVLRIEYAPSPGDPSSDTQQARRRRFEASLHRCHLLFVTQANDLHWQEIHELIENRPIVTVSDMKGFSKSGGLIEFVLAPRGEVEREKMGIDIHVNLAAGRQAGLRFSSRFLDLKRVFIVDEGHVPKKSASRQGGR